ncbi:MAG: THxN family PEP-CTERM protein [Halioglobus sp.]|nr:THxN family PEP-CTERM protein [Halioglobus sp.]
MKITADSIRKNLTYLAAAAAIATSASTHATLANGIVDQWTVDVHGEFLCGTAQFTGSGGSCNVSTMNWGTSTGSGLSGLDIGNLPNTAVDTNGPPVANMTITHRNQPITGTSLDKVTLRSTLTLTPLTPSDTSLPQTSLDFLIDFFESPNSDAICADGGAWGVGVNSNGCGDIFVIDQNSLNFPFTYDLEQPGGPGPVQYFISFFEQTNGLQPLSNAACASAGAAPGCLGFVTPEGRNTTFNYAAVITTSPVEVPVPGTLPALGLGLLLLAARRRKH